MPTMNEPPGVVHLRRLEEVDVERQERAAERADQHGRGHVGQAELVVEQARALDLGELVFGDGLAFLDDDLAVGLERLVGDVAGVQRRLAGEHGRQDRDQREARAVRRIRKAAPARCRCGSFAWLR